MSGCSLKSVKKHPGEKCEKEKKKYWTYSKPVLREEKIIAPKGNAGGEAVCKKGGFRRREGE